MYSFGSRVLHDLDLRQNYSPRGTALHLLYVVGVVHGKCYLWKMCDFGQSWITEQPILVRVPLCRDAKNAETVLFTMLFAFVLHGHNAEKCTMTMPLANAANRCTFWTSCTGVS